MSLITQGKANIKYLLTVAVVAAIFGTLIFNSLDAYRKEMNSMSQAMQVKSNENQEISSKVVWTRVSEEGILSALHECNYEEKDCIAQVMSKNGASPEAIKFYKEENWFVTKFARYDKVVLLEVVDVWRANSNEDYVLVSMNKKPFSVEGSLKNLEGDVFKIFPEYILWSTDNYFAIKDANSFIFNVELKDGCHACGTGYSATIAFDFDQNGNYIGERLIGFCTEEGKEDSKYPRCMSSI